MREIKFKAKTSDGEWLEGLYSTSTDNGETTHYIGDFNLSTPIKRHTLCQFTGLTDKNGKEVYEGDIYSIHNNKYCISFYSGCFVGHKVDDRKSVSHPMGWCYDEDSEGELVIDYFYKQIEVIGNIHDK